MALYTPQFPYAPISPSAISAALSLVRWDGTLVLFLLAAMRHRCD
jgi:hypothetical protein